MSDFEKLINASDLIEWIMETYPDWCVGAVRSIVDHVESMRSTQPEWNNHTVACLLAELFDDTCACNYNDIDEWLPGKCELLDSCPNPVGVACWEQFLKHKAERRSKRDVEYYSGD